MELVIPEFGMLFWFILVFFFALLPALFALIDVFLGPLNSKKKLIWTLVILCLPLVGWVFYMFQRRKQKSTSQ